MPADEDENGSSIQAPPPGVGVDAPPVPENAEKVGNEDDEENQGSGDDEDVQESDDEEEEGGGGSGNHDGTSTTGKGKKRGRKEAFNGEPLEFLHGILDDFRQLRENKSRGVIRRHTQFWNTVQTAFWAKFDWNQFRKQPKIHETEEEVIEYVNKVWRSGLWFLGLTDNGFVGYDDMVPVENAAGCH